MEDIDIISICEEVKTRLSKMGYEKDNIESNGQLIFPMKTQKKEDNKKEETEDRISEQELRQLFIEVFKETYKVKDKDLYFSIETPTNAKYKFGKVDKEKYPENPLRNIRVDEKGQSALLDMCVFRRNKGYYNRILNIEFKHGNAPLEDIAKDVLKLMREEQNGVFIFLLDNTNVGSLNNAGRTRKGVLDKLSESFEKFKEYKNNWKENDKKRIQLIIISLERKTHEIGPAVLIHRSLVKNSFKDLKTFFSINENGSGNITEVSGWQMK